MNLVMMVLVQQPTQFGSWSGNSPKPTPQALPAGLSLVPSLSLDAAYQSNISTTVSSASLPLLLRTTLHLKDVSQHPTWHQTIFPLYFFSAAALLWCIVVHRRINSLHHNYWLHWTLQSFHLPDIHKQGSILHSVKFLWRVDYRAGICYSEDYKTGLDRCY